jgi:CDP-diglyceride synthetase
MGMLIRTITGLVAAAVALTLLTLPKPIPALAIAVFFVLSIYELGRAVKAKPIGMLLIILVNLAVLWVLGELATMLFVANKGDVIMHFGIIAAATCVLQLILSSAMLKGFLAGKARIINYCWHSLVFISIPVTIAASWSFINPLSLILLLGLAAANDTGAAYGGKLFGRRRISPSISPNKTLEGVVGGFAGMLGYVLVVHFVLASYAAHNLYIAYYVNYSQPRNAAFIALACAWLAAVGFIGDITFSAIKRKAGLKDFGTILPGHGGLLDRIDALLFIAPWYFLALYIMLYAPWYLSGH